MSVTDAPSSRDFFEFFTMQGPTGPFWNAGSPISKYSKHLIALSSSDLRSFLLFSRITVLKLAVMTFVSGLGGMSLKGNCFQNSVDPCPPYSSSLGMLGFFNGPSVLVGSGVVVAGDDAKSQNIMIDHFAGRPRSALDAGLVTPG